MISFRNLKGFSWDKGNIDKSYLKHGITQSESEEIFLDENLKTVEDIKHSGKETRSIALGKTFDGKVLFVVYTLRTDKIRIISARKANKKERVAYEQKT